MTITHSERLVAPSSSRFLTILSAVLARVRERHQQLRSLKDARAAFMTLVHQDDRVLDDVGVTREEVLWAASLPLEANAALALRERAVLRRRAAR